MFVFKFQSNNRTLPYSDHNPLCTQKKKNNKRNERKVTKYSSLVINISIGLLYSHAFSYKSKTCV